MALGDLTTLANVKQWAFPDTAAQALTTNDGVLTRLITQCSQRILAELQRPSLLSQTYTDLCDGFDQSAEYLDNWPVTAVSQVAINGRTIPPAPLPIGAVVTNDYGYRLQPWDGYSPGGPQAVELIGARFSRGRLNVSITYQAGYLVASEMQTVPASPYKITALQPLGPWAGDVGVTYAAGGALVAVTGTPSRGQYNVNAGDYTFAPADANAGALLAYSYTPGPLEDACISWVAERYSYRSRIGQRSASLGGQETTSYDISAIPAYVAAALQPFKKVLPV